MEETKEMENAPQEKRTNVEKILQHDNPGYQGVALASNYFKEVELSELENKNNNEIHLYVDKRELKITHGTDPFSYSLPIEIKTKKYRGAYNRS